MKSIYTNGMKYSGGLTTFMRENKFAVVVAVAWLVLVWGFVLAGNAWYKEPFSLANWAGSWDGAWYRSIVEGGYYRGVIDHQVNVAFFPLLPALTWLVSKVALVPTIWAGMVVSTVSFAAALLVLWHFVSKFFTRQTARWTLLLVAFNPFSLYFGMLYTESLFLLLAVSAFWFMYNKQWWLAAFFAGLATATRSVGVAVAITVMVGWVVERFKKPKSKKEWHPKPYSGQASRQVNHPTRILHSAQKSGGGKIAEKQRARTPWFFWLPQTLLLGLVAFSGILAFSAFLWWHTGDPFAYRTGQQHWPGRGGLSNVGNEIAYLWEHRVINLEYLITAMWYVSGILAFIGVVLVVRMRQWLMALYSSIALSLPVLFGTAASLNRYSQVVFPIFIAAALLIQKWPLWLRVALIVVSIMALGLITFLVVDPRDIMIA